MYKLFTPDPAGPGRQFVAKFSAKVRTLKVGNGFEDGVTQGPLRRCQAVWPGREGSHHGIDDYVELKFLCIGDVLK